MRIQAPSTVALSPILFLNRSADVFPDKTAVVLMDGSTVSYRELRCRAVALATGLKAVGVGINSRVAALLPNCTELLEAHFGIPGSGAAIVALNTRLRENEYAYILHHSECKILLVHERYGEVIDRLVATGSLANFQLILWIGSGSPPEWAHAEYETWLATHRQLPASKLSIPDDENQAIAINYTSGTTGAPKGVIYTHRGAFLNSMSQVVHLALTSQSIFLWTLPMFHCNGWCLTWGVTAVGATHVCQPSFVAEEALDALSRFGITHFCGAPVVMDALVLLTERSLASLGRRVIGATGGGPPSPAAMQRMRSIGIEVRHLYGLTETYGPSMGCELQPSWAGYDDESLAMVLSRQGVRNVHIHEIRVLDSSDADVPNNGISIGEIVIRSATVMHGYLNDDKATEDAFRGGYFRTGDLAVVHADGYIEIRDRAKDIIISGGENISSIEVENVLSAHPAVSKAAVVAMAHPKWGEVPVAFIELCEGARATQDELVEHARKYLAGFKVPRLIRFQFLPHTSTGKVIKAELRSSLATIHDMGQGFTDDPPWV